MSGDLVEDVQNSPDLRNLALDRVGIRGIRHPLVFEEVTPEGKYTLQHTVARFEMLVDLPKHVKGTHMSRFIEILNEQETRLSLATLQPWLHAMVKRLNANCGYFQARFPYFIQKYAPISKVPSLMDYDILLEGISEKSIHETRVTLVVPVTSLCPCSKKIANYGAHNQRSHVTVVLQIKPSVPVSITKIIQLVESKASCELYGILKRADEKNVTERAYDNPQFVEDTVRDIAQALDRFPGILGYKISSENFESIHNHSAYAEIDKLWTPEKVSQKTYNFAEKVTS